MEADLHQLHVSSAAVAVHALQNLQVAQPTRGKGIVLLKDKPLTAARLIQGICVHKWPVLYRWKKHFFQWQTAGRQTQLLSYTSCVHLRRALVKADSSLSTSDAWDKPLGHNY